MLKLLSKNELGRNGQTFQLRGTNDRGDFIVLLIFYNINNNI